MKELLIKEASKYLKARLRKESYEAKKITDGILELSLYPTFETGILKRTGLLPDSDKVFFSRNGEKWYRFVKFEGKNLAFRVNRNRICEIYLVPDNKLETVIEKLNKKEELKKISLYPPTPLSFCEEIEYGDYNDVNWLKWNKREFKDVLQEFLSSFNLKFDNFKEVIEKYDNPSLDCFRSDSFFEYELLSNMGNEITQKFLDSMDGIDIGFGLQILIPDKIQGINDVDMIELPILNKEIIDFWEGFIEIDYIDYQITVYPDGRHWSVSMDEYSNNMRKFLVTQIEISVNTRKKYIHIFISKGDEIKQGFYLPYDALNNLRDILRKYNAIYKEGYWDCSWYYIESYYYVAESIYDTQTHKLIKELKNYEVANPYKTYKCCNDWEIIVCD